MGIGFHQRDQALEGARVVAQLPRSAQGPRRRRRAGCGAARALSTARAWSSLARAVTGARRPRLAGRLRPRRGLRRAGRGPPELPQRRGQLRVQRRDRAPRPTAARVADCRPPPSSSRLGDPGLAHDVERVLAGELEAPLRVAAAERLADRAPGPAPPSRTRVASRAARVGRPGGASRLFATSASSTSSEASATGSAASTVHPPANTARRTNASCSRALESRTLHSTSRAASAGALARRAAAGGDRITSPSRRSSCAGVSRPIRAAASSIASGRPSSRAHSVGDALALSPASARNDGVARSRARDANNSRRARSGNGSTGNACSPRRPQQLAAGHEHGESRRRRRAARRRPARRSITCSKLSTISRLCSSAAMPPQPPASRQCACASVGATCSALADRGRARRSGRRPESDRWRRRPSSTASVVLPTPPGPVSVSRRTSGRSSSSAHRAISRVAADQLGGRRRQRGARAREAGRRRHGASELARARGSGRPGPLAIARATTSSNAGGSPGTTSVGRGTGTFRCAAMTACRVGHGYGGSPVRQW